MQAWLAGEGVSVVWRGGGPVRRYDAPRRTLTLDSTQPLESSRFQLAYQVCAVALADAIAQRDRDRAANEIEAVAWAIEQAVPRFEIGAAALIDAVTRSKAALSEATRFAADVDEIRREVLAAAELICWELRSAAVRTRVGNANVALLAPPETKQLPPPESDRQMVYTLSPLSWREGDEVRRVAAFTMAALPKTLLTAALQHQHVDYLNARRVQTLMHVHGSGQQQVEPGADDPALVDLDALAVAGQAAPQADVA
jgi:hypothetical protein